MQEALTGIKEIDAVGGTAALVAAQTVGGTVSDPLVFLLLLF